MTMVSIRRGTSPLERVALASLGCAAFLFSWMFAPFHQGGDQIYYRHAYEIVRNLPLDSALEAYRSVIYSFEPLHFLICWLGSTAGVDKDLLMAIFNATLAYSSALFLYRRIGSLGFAIILVVTNYYLYAMFFTLEKLKIAFTFFMLFMVGDKHKANTWVFLFFSFMAHFQMTIIVGAMLGGYVSGMRSYMVKPWRIALLVAALAFVAVIAISFGSYIVSKIDYYLRYAEKPSVEDLILIGALTFITILLSKERRHARVFLSVLILAVMTLGGDRLNMFFYFAFLAFVNFHGGTARLLAWTSLPFISYKTINYIQMVVQGGG